MSKPGPTPDPELVAQILVENDLFGQEETAKKYGVSDRTIRRYSAERRKDPLVAELVRQKRQAISRDWVERTADARETLLKVMLSKAEAGDVTLREVAGAFKLVHEANVSERLIMEGQDPRNFPRSDDEPDPAHSSLAEGAGAGATQAARGDAATGGPVRH